MRSRPAAIMDGNDDALSRVIDLQFDRTADVHDGVGHQFGGEELRQKYSVARKIVECSRDKGSRQARAAQRRLEPAHRD